MSDFHTGQTVLSPAKEQLAIQSVVSLKSPSETYIADAEQAIGRTLSIDTKAARSILDELIHRKLIEARPEHPASNKLEPGYQPSLVRARWFRTNNEESWTTF